MKKILVAIDGSEGALRAVDYVSQQFTGLSDLQITLFHVSQGVPPELWDDGHILDEQEKAARKKVLDKWLSDQKLKLEPIFRPAVQRLTQGGIEPQKIETKLVSESVKNTAECILAEAKTGGYQTLVMGRCGVSPIAHTLLGSIVHKIMNGGAGVAVCVVE
jgi:nucleotide-binding universal stress UspA family protein